MNSLANLKSMLENSHGNFSHGIFQLFIHILNFIRISSAFTQNVTIVVLYKLEHKLNDSNFKLFIPYTLKTYILLKAVRVYFDQIGLFRKIF